MTRSCDAPGRSERLRKGKLKVEAAVLDDVARELPQHVARDRVDIDAPILVKPVVAMGPSHSINWWSASGGLC